MTSIGQLVRPCWPAQRTNQNRATPPNVRAYLGKTFVVDAVTHNAVRIGGNVWLRSWVRVESVESRICATLPTKPYTTEELANVREPRTTKEKAFFRYWGYVPFWRKL